MDQLEEYFDEYLETQESEEIFSDLFSAIRKAFIADTKPEKTAEQKRRTNHQASTDRQHRIGFGQGRIVVTVITQSIFTEKIISFSF